MYSSYGRSQPPEGVLDAIRCCATPEHRRARKVPANAPTAFIKPRWTKLVLTDEGIDQRYYELCAVGAEERAALG
jgi:hypothetical protein